MEKSINWSRYAKRFRREADKHGYDENYIKHCLSYARSLHEKRLPIIFDQKHLALLVGYIPDYLHRVSNSQKHFYRFFKILKISGGYRKIEEPLPSLKEIQRWILDNILYQPQISKFAKAFIRGRSIRENARFHRKQEQVLTLDIKDFFSSIKASRVAAFFKRIGYNKAVSTMLTKLCTLNNHLPQGAPTSPALSNLLSIRMDRRLSAYALKNGIRYTRYADDLTFSGSFNPSSVIRLVRQVLFQDGLELNEDKTRLMLKHKRQEVTGIVVNKKMQAPRPLRRKLRQDIYYIDKYGLDPHMAKTNKERANYVNHLRGIADFILFVNPKDRDAHHAMKILSDF